MHRFWHTNQNMIRHEGTPDHYFPMKGSFLFLTNELIFDRNLEGLFHSSAINVLKSTSSDLKLEGLIDGTGRPRFAKMFERSPRPFDAHLFIADYKSD